MKILKLNRCQLNHDHGAALTSALVDNYKLKILEVDGNRMALSDGGLPQGWVDLLESSTSLEELNISRNGLQSRGVAVLFTALAKNRSLRKVTMDGNRFGDEGTTAALDEVVYMFSTNTFLQEVHMAEMGFGDEVLERIADGLASNRILKKLIAPRNNISTRGILDCTKHLALNTTLEELELACARVQQNESEYLRSYKLIIDNTNLETIVL